MESFYKRSNLIVTDIDKRAQVHEILEQFVISDEALLRIFDIFETALTNANSRYPEIRKKSNLLMIPSYIRQLLDGTENGEFIGLDIGGTKFRILHTEFTSGIAQTKSREFMLSEGTLSGPAEGVFDYIATCIKTFLLEESLLDRKLPVGFTFSFPMTQESIRSGILVTWTKSFRCPNGVGEDAVKMLEEAIDRIGGLSVQIEAILGDTVACLLAGSYIDNECRVGCIIGTGSNCSYVEYLDQIDKWNGDLNEPNQMIINVECGGFGDNGCINFMKTSFDKDVDEHSNHVGSYTFEKMFAGLYLGELVRTVLEKLTKDGLLFQGKGSDELFKRGNFHTSHVSRIEGDKDSSKNTLEVLNEMNLDAMSGDDDVSIVRETCAVVSQRGAYLIATGE